MSFVLSTPRTLIVRSKCWTNKEGPVLSPEGDFFEKMDTIKVSHRSPSVPLQKIPLVLVYDRLTPENHSSPILQYQNHRKSIFGANTFTSLT
jgi:hypothetical protein